MPISYCSKLVSRIISIIYSRKTKPVIFPTSQGTFERPANPPVSYFLPYKNEPPLNTVDIGVILSRHSQIVYKKNF